MSLLTASWRHFKPFARLKVMDEILAREILATDLDASPISHALDHFNCLEDKTKCTIPALKNTTGMSHLSSH